MNRNWQDDLAFALKVADAADAVSLCRFEQGLPAHAKADGTLVSAADLDVEKVIRELVADQRPDDLVLGEEESESHATVDFESPVWIIDPIDHTCHFLRRNPDYATLIALVADGVTRAAVVSAPSLGKRWCALRGEGAWAGGSRLLVSATRRLRSVHLGLAGHREWLDRYRWASISRLLDSVEYPYGTAGGFGAAMMVASAQLDAFAEPWGAIWDHAATALIVEEAGGRASTLEGQSPRGGSLLVSNGHLHDELLTYFQR